MAVCGRGNREYGILNLTLELNEKMKFITALIRANRRMGNEEAVFMTRKEI